MTYLLEMVLRILRKWAWIEIQKGDVVGKESAVLEEGKVSMLFVTRVCYLTGVLTLNGVTKCSLLF